MTADGKKIAGTRAAFLNVVIHRQVKHPARLRQAPFVALAKYVYMFFYHYYFFFFLLLVSRIYQTPVRPQGPCCTAECNLRFGDKCRDDNGCRDASFCDGRSAYCPPSINKPNKTICNREFVCFMGVSMRGGVEMFFSFGACIFSFVSCSRSVPVVYALHTDWNLASAFLAQTIPRRRPASSAVGFQERTNPACTLYKPFYAYIFFFFLSR